MKIKILEKGPLAVDGDIPMKEVVMVMDNTGKVTEFKDGKKYDKTDTPKYICRCGHSKNKPFCDGRHKETGFDGKETTDRKKYNAAAETIDKNAVKEANLMQSAKRFGPVSVTGGIQIVGADDFEYAPKKQTALCRCGLSKNMPFCDGAHVHAAHMEIK